MLNIKMLNMKETLDEMIRRIIKEEIEETINATFSGTTQFMKRFAIPQFKKYNLKYKIQPDEFDEGITEIWIYNASYSNLKLIGKFLEDKDSTGEKYGGFFEGLTNE